LAWLLVVGLTAVGGRSARNSPHSGDRPRGIPAQLNPVGFGDKAEEIVVANVYIIE
jgi:hypothetical protein